MQNHLIAITILGLSLFYCTRRPSLGLLCLIAGGAWNLIDYWPDSAITDPYALGNLLFNPADVVILIGFLFIATDFITGVDKFKRKNVVK